MSYAYEDSVEAKESKFMVNLAKEKIANFVRGKSFYSEELNTTIDFSIPQTKIELAYKDTLEGLSKKNIKITEEQKEKLRAGMYPNLERAFIREINELFDEYSHLFSNKKVPPRFQVRLERIYQKYCGDIQTEENVESNDSIINSANAQIKKQFFVNGVTTICTSYGKKQIILSEIDDLAQKYGQEEVTTYIDKVGNLFGVSPLEIEAMQGYITKDFRYTDGFIFTRSTSHAHRLIVGLYKTYKGKNYNELIDTDENGIINLDDYAYVNSNRRAGNMSVRGSWIISSNLDNYYSTKPASDITAKEKLSVLLSDALAKKLPEEEPYSYEEDEDAKDQKDDEQKEKLHEIELTAKRLATFLQTPVINAGKTALDQMSDDLTKQAITEIKTVINDDSLSNKEQLETLRKIDVITPTDTSEDSLQELIDMINDPNVDVNASQILTVLISETPEQMEEKEKNRQDKIDYLSASLVSKICDYLQIEDGQDKLNIFLEFNNEFQGKKLDIAEKNSFFIPQLARQIGIDAAVYYKATNSNSGAIASISNIKIGSVMEILKKFNLVDDTRYHLTKNFVKPDENLIIAKDFMPETKNGRIRMATIYDATSKFVRSHYAKKGLSAKQAEDDFKLIRQGIIKQSIFNKMINYTNESNDTWGLIETPDGRLRLAPMFVYEPSTTLIPGNNVRRVVRENSYNIMDFINKYSKEEWFRKWIDNTVVDKLNFDKACQEMTRLTGVTLNEEESEYYRSQIFDTTLSFVTIASKVNYNEEKLKEEWKDRATLLQKAKRSAKTIQAKFLVKKRDIKDRFGKKTDDGSSR